MLKIVSFFSCKITKRESFQEKFVHQLCTKSLAMDRSLSGYPSSQGLWMLRLPVSSSPVTEDFYNKLGAVIFRRVVLSTLLVYPFKVISMSIWPAMQCEQGTFDQNDVHEHKLKTNEE